MTKVYVDDLISCHVVSCSKLDTNQFAINNLVLFKTEPLNLFLVKLQVSNIRNLVLLDVYSVFHEMQQETSHSNIIDLFNQKKNTFKRTLLAAPPSTSLLAVAGEIYPMDQPLFPLP